MFSLDFKEKLIHIEICNRVKLHENQYKRTGYFINRIKYDIHQAGTVNSQCNTKLRNDVWITEYKK